MRKMLFSLLVFSAAALLLSPEAGADARPETGAAAAIVMNSGGEVVYEQNADMRLPIASTTKLLTALVTLEEVRSGDIVEIRPEWTGAEGSSMYLKAGESYTVRELLEGLLLASGNDAAEALACHVAGGIEAFAGKMNARASELGLRDSHFANPHGLDDEGHYGSARDLAVLMAACLKNRELAAILAEKSSEIGGQFFYNHNRLLTLCPGCIGGKTGYTESAGRCLVSCCEREGTRLICVTLNDPNDWVDHQVLYNWAFSRYSTRNVTEKLSFLVPVISGSESLLPVSARELRLFLPRTAEITLVAHLPRFVFAPVKAGERAGTLQIFRDGEWLRETELFFTADAGLNRGKA